MKLLRDAGNHLLTFVIFAMFILGPLLISADVRAVPIDVERLFADNALSKINVITKITGFVILCLSMIVFHCRRERDENRKLMQAIDKQGGTP